MDTPPAIDQLDTDFLYNQLPSGFISFKPDGKILRVNETFSNWLGIAVEEVYELNFRSVLTNASAMYYNMVIDPILNLQSTANEIYLTFSTPDGDIDTLLNAVSYKDDQGDLLLINATVQKITDRKKYESALLHEKRHAEDEKRKFEFLSNSVANQIWTTSADGTCIYVNQKIKDYFGEQSMDYYTSFRGIAEADHEKSYQSWKKCLETGKPFEREVRLKGINNNEEWFLLTMTPYINQDGDIESWFGSSTNIHKQKTLQLANYSSLTLSLNSAQKHLDENKKLFYNIAMSQSHMIRKPLANMMGLMQLIRDEELSADCRGLFTLLEKSAAELDEMIKRSANFKGSV